MKGSHFLRLIIFDLEGTLWPFSVGSSKFAAPFKISEGSVYDKEGTKVELYPETLEVLDTWSKKCTLAVSSGTHYPQGAESLFKLFGIEKYIDFKELAPAVNRSSDHVSRILQRTGFAPHDVLYLDDDQRNLKELKFIGLKSVLVNPDVGVTKKLIENTVMDNFLGSRRE